MQPSSRACFDLHPSDRSAPSEFRENWDVNDFLRWAHTAAEQSYADSYDILRVQLRPGDRRLSGLSLGVPGSIEKVRLGAPNLYLEIPARFFAVQGEVLGLVGGGDSPG